MERARFVRKLCRCFFFASFPIFVFLFLEQYTLTDLGNWLAFSSLGYDRLCGTGHATQKQRLTKLPNTVACLVVIVLWLSQLVMDLAHIVRMRSELSMCCACSAYVLLMWTYFTFVKIPVSFPHEPHCTSSCSVYFHVCVLFSLPSQSRLMRSPSCLCLCILHINF
jgi:hypothetical protein